MTTARARRALTVARRHQRTSPPAHAPAAEPERLPEPDPAGMHLDVLVIQQGQRGPFPALTTRDGLTPMVGKPDPLPTFDLEPGERGLPLGVTVDLVARRRPELKEMLGNGTPRQR